MKENVIINNAFNELNLGHLTKVSMDLFMTICFMVKNKGTTVIQIDFDTIKQRALYRPSKDHDLIRDLNYMAKQLISVNSSILEIKPNGKRKVQVFNLFKDFNFDEDTEKFIVSINEKYAWLFNEFDEYTIFELKEIVSFKSKYTKNLFRLLKQWKSIGSLKICGEDKIREFRKKIGVPDSCSTAEMIRKCLKPAIKEIKDSHGSIKNLTINLEYAQKRGCPLKAIIFKFDKIKCEKKNTEEPTDSIYLTVQEILKDHPEFKEGDIISIAKKARENKLDDIEIKRRINDFLGRFEKKGCPNPTGYIIRLMENYNPPVCSNNGKTSFSNFNERDYDYKELEKKFARN